MTKIVILPNGDAHILGDKVEYVDMRTTIQGEQAISVELKDIDVTELSKVYDNTVQLHPLQIKALETPSISQEVIDAIKACKYKTENDKTYVLLPSFDRYLECQDPTPEEVGKKLGIDTPVLGIGYYLGSNFHNNKEYANTRYYDYTLSGIALSTQEARDRCMMTPDMINNLIECFGGSSVAGYIIPIILNIGYPGIRLSDGSPCDVGDRCVVWSSQESDSELARTGFFYRDGDAYRNYYCLQNHARSVVFLED